MSFYTLSIKFNFKERTNIYVLCFGGGSFCSPYGIQIFLVTSLVISPNTDEELLSTGSKPIFIIFMIHH